MNDPQPDRERPDDGGRSVVDVDATALATRLAAHRTIGAAPAEELAWLIERGTLERFDEGAMIARKGEPVPALYVILTGRVAHHMNQGGTWRTVVEWQAGDVAGHLPYSRMTVAPGNSVVGEPSDLLCIPRADLAEMPYACPTVTAALVHVMVDRARAFKSSDLQAEKMASLGKLAAGLAHELNNPASAAARGARLMPQALAESDAAARALGAAQLDDAELAAIERVRGACLATPSANVLSPLDRADREEAVAEWLMTHGSDEALAPPLAETSVTLGQLDAFADALSGDKLHAALHWIAAGCTVGALARDVERAASRMHTLVSAVKGFTYMDHATTREPVDIAQGLADTLTVLGGKARGKSASLTVDVAPHLPRVLGFGGELNQVWANLVDNALDAIGPEGRVTVTARGEGDRLVVRVTDDGPGIAPEVRSRIFDPFFTTKPVGTGTGLGLDIVRRLVDQSQGTIDVESEPGRTVFRVSLPVA